MTALFDSVAMMLRIKLAAQVDTEVALLGAANPLERIKIASRLADLLQQLTGEGLPATDPLQVELEAAEAELEKHKRLINLGALTPAATAAIDRYSAAKTAIERRDREAELAKALERDIGSAVNKPRIISAADALTPAGAIKTDAKNSKADSAIWYYQGDIKTLGFTASVRVGGQLSAGADRAKATLVGLKAARSQGFRLVSMRAGSLGTVWVLESPDGKGFMTRGGFEDASNPVFARPPMPEDAPGYESMLAGQTALAKAFVTWLDTLPYEQRHNQGVVTRKINSTAIADWLRINTDLLGIFIQYRGANGAMRTRIQGKDFDAMVALARDLATMPEIEPAAPAPTSTMTAKGNPLIDEVVLADLGLIREVFGRWKYRDAVGAPELFANTKEDAIERGSDAHAKAAPGELLTKEQRWDKSNADFYAEFDGRYGNMSIEQVRAIMEAAKPDGASTLTAHAREFNGGGRRTGPAVATQGAREGAELARQLERYIAERLEKEGNKPSTSFALYTNPRLYHGTALPFTSYTGGTRKGSGYDHQGKGFYLTNDKRGYAHFFALQAADKILNGPNEPEGEEARILEGGGVILDVSLASDARIIDLTRPQASPELLAMVKNITEGAALRERVLAEGYDGVAFIEPNAPEGVQVEGGAVTVVVYNTDKASIAGFEEAANVQALDLGETAVPEPTGRAPAGGTTGMNGEFYKGGTFLPNTTLPKQGAAPGGKAASGRGFLIEPGVFAHPPEPGFKAILNSYQQFIGVDNGAATVTERPDAAIAAFVNEDVAEGRAFLRAAVDAYNAGMRWYKSGQIEVTEEHREVPAPVIIEHTTGKGKVLRGIVRQDLTYAEAKAIDEYTFKKDGGWFIREKHLQGFAGSTAIKAKDPAARPDPEDPEAEMRRLEAAAQAQADRLANEQLRQQEKITKQVAKLREVAASTLERAEAEVGRDRLANTARRARMAASGREAAEATRAIALTMNNLADAIERGQAQHLSGITSRADVETLVQRLVGARSEYERANDISYSESQRRKHDPITADEARYATFPDPKWDTAGANRARVLELIKGKKGAPALAQRIRYAPYMKAEDVQELRAMIGQKEADSQLGWWNIEQLARAARLRRAGITNTLELRDALAEFVEFKQGARPEDPIAKAERAIIGQKVGLDFFPTPSGEATTMARLAQIKAGDDVLEPSAGNGNLADAAKAAGANVDVIELSPQLQDILQAKGYNLVATDFETFTPSKQYDAIVMNPPFSNRKDAAHIMRAFTMLKPGGRLVAIAGEGVFFGSDKAAVAFREWLEANGAEVEGLAAKTFMDTKLLATTGANARRIVLTR